MIRMLALLLLLLPVPALAWGDYAHRLTARIAWAQLQPAARAEIRRILARSAAVDTPPCPLATIEDASVWPDCARGLGDRFAYSAPWHYQNISVCEPFDISAKCWNGDCVTAQIPRQLAILKDRSRSAKDRAMALAFVVHLVGDMHQPLHIGDKDDRGGNDVRAAFGFKDPDLMNLHRIWDSELAEGALTRPPAIGPAGISPARRRQLAAGSVADWAREAWEISRTVAYPELKSYPDSCPIPRDQRPRGARGVVDQAYVDAASASVRLQVERAGTRMARLLNTALAR